MSNYANRVEAQITVYRNIHQKIKIYLYSKLMASEWKFHNSDEKKGKNTKNHKICCFFVPLATALIKGGNSHIFNHYYNFPYINNFSLITLLPTL